MNVGDPSVLDLSQPWRLPIELERSILIACGKRALNFRSRVQDSRDERWRDLVTDHMVTKPDETDGPPLRALYKSDLKVALEVFVENLALMDDREAERAIGAMMRRVALR